MIKIIQRRNIWFTLSLIMVAISIVALASWQLRFGIDFTGGTMMEVGFNGTTLTNQEVQESLASLNLGDINVQPSQQGTVFLKFKSVDETTHQAILSALDKKAATKLASAGAAPAAPAATDAAAPASAAPVQVQAQDASGANADVSVTPAAADATATATPANATGNQYVTEKSFESIGPVVGNELKSSAVWAVTAAVIAIILYIAWAFRKVSYPVSSFKYGIVAAVALLHDVLSTVGVFSILGHFWGIEVGISFVAAILTILGYSVHDTIVVFDRIRENLFKYRSDDFEETVNGCVNETLVRSINTSFTVVLVLSVLFLFGGSSIRYFVLTLIVGVAFGTYSSIFIASPLLVAWQQWDVKHNHK